MLFGGFAVGLWVRWVGSVGGLLGAHEGEEHYVADGAAAGEDHGEAVDADAFAGGWGEAVAEGADVVVVDFGHGFGVAALAVVELGLGSGGAGRRGR